MQKQIGVLVGWKPDKHFGFIQIVEPVSTGGYAIHKFFVHESRIEFVTSRITVGCVCLFDVSKYPPKFPGAAPFALNVEIYDTLAQAELINQAADAVQVPLPKRGKDGAP